MIYVDSSVVLAEVFAKGRAPSPGLWRQQVISSRLLEYELWTRIHSRRLAATHGETLRSILSRIAFVELSSEVLARALEPFPLPVKTLDALHLASMDFVRKLRRKLTLATFDQRMQDAAAGIGIDISPP